MSESGDEPRSPIGRRRFVALAGLVAVGIGAGIRRIRGGRDVPGMEAPEPTPSPHGTHPMAPAPAPGTARTAAPGPGGSDARWSDPATWEGRIPGPRDVVTLARRVLLDRSVVVAGLSIEPGAALVFEPAARLTLTSAGNVVVKGRLVMRPGARGEHVLRFEGVREEGFAGGGMQPLRGDVGLWVIGAGVWEAAGSPKRAWARTAGPIAAGATSVLLAEDPTGWRAGDEVAITPTTPPSDTEHARSIDHARILTIEGRRVRLSRATEHAHPAVTVAPGRTYRAEMLNLTRTVRVEGTPGGRTHVFIRTDGPQTLRHIAVRYAGPRTASRETDVVLGRYGLHFHLMGEASRGSLIEGAVIRECGSHAFVPHGSHGITLRECIAYDTLETAFWWDPGPENATNDLFYDRCVAALVRSEPAFRGFRHAGFWMGAGSGSRARGCVATAVQGSVNASGFIWPEFSVGVWDFEDCLAHNNAVDGLFVWQNTPMAHVVSRFVAYHCGKAGIEHGAYRNGYRYEDSILYGNGDAAIVLHATSRAKRVLRFAGLTCDGAGISDYLVRLESHTLAGGHETEFSSCVFRGARTAAIALVPPKPGEPHLLDVMGCRFEGNPLWLAADIDPASIVRTTSSGLGTLAVRRFDRPGAPRPEWNASVTPISAW